MYSVSASFLESTSVWICFSFTVLEDDNTNSGQNGAHEGWLIAKSKLWKLWAVLHTLKCSTTLGFVLSSAELWIYSKCRKSESDIWRTFHQTVSFCEILDCDVYRLQGTLTSSVIRVAMDLPISWYWAPLPKGPSRINRNLKAKINKRTPWNWKQIMDDQQWLFIEQVM